MVPFGETMNHNLAGFDKKTRPTHFLSYSEYSPLDGYSFCHNCSMIVNQMAYSDCNPHCGTTLFWFLIKDNNVWHSMLIIPLSHSAKRFITVPDCCIMKINRARSSTQPASDISDKRVYRLVGARRNVTSKNDHIHGLVQGRRSSIANALDLHLSCTYPYIFSCGPRQM